jgi:hypothetical protein
VTEQRSALDNALDVLVYAPVGLALTAAEEVPKLAAKGRAQVQGQITVARMVGQFAVAQGRKEIEKRFGLAARRPEPARGAPPPPASKGAPGGVQPDTGSENGSYDRLSARPAPSAAEEAADPGSSAGADAPVVDVDFGARAGSDGPGEAQAPASPRAASASRPKAAALAIPGYDSLSASQVVQRLAGLSQAELAAVGEYEAAHRGRRTILTRIGQLQG